MSRSLENLEQFAIDVILERRGGVRAAVLRSFLYLLSLIYERLVQFRLFLYRKRGLLAKLRGDNPDPPRVVSDGKSLLLDSLTAGDEPYMLAHNLKSVAVLVDKDRVKSGLFAIEKMNADTLLLDDGLQYLHLKHRLDIVLVDRQAPFGNEFLLPRGTLREPPRNLRRASYVFITKSTGESNEQLVKRI